MTTRAKADGTRMTDKTYGGAHVENDTAGRPAADAVGSFAAKLRVDPADNIIVGAEHILRYLGISSITTLWRWVEHYGLPAFRRPDGLWMSSMTAIDQWIFLAAEVVNENREYSRGQNAPAAIAAQRAARAAAEPGRFEHKRFVAAKRASRGVGLMHGRKEPKAPYKGRDRVYTDGLGPGTAQRVGDEQRASRALALRPPAEDAKGENRPENPEQGENRHEGGRE